MILESEVFKIGKLIKPHGVKGEIVFAFENDIFDKVDNPYLICLIEGIFVPFFIEEYRFKGKDTALVKFEDIDFDDKAKVLNNTDIFFPRKYFKEANDNIQYSWNYFIGYTLVDNSTGSKVGIIDSIEDSTLNILFIVHNEQMEYLIPVAENLISGVENEGKLLWMDLPEGLLEQ